MSYIMNNGIYTETALNTLAKELADQLSGSETIFLTGPLGAGKTTFTRALVSQLAPQATVSSPTFQLVNEYLTSDGRRIIHADLYRLTNPDDTVTLGLDEYITDPNTLTVIEWPEIGAPHLPKPDLHLHLDHRNATTRHLTVTTYKDD